MADDIWGPYIDDESPTFKTDKPWWEDVWDWGTEKAWDYISDVAFDDPEKTGLIEDVAGLLK